MSILDPAIGLVGRLSFRHKMHATALVFGAPLVIALGVILAGLGARVSAVQNEREALAVQLPALTVLVNVHQYLAASQAWREGAEHLGELVLAKREGVTSALKTLASALGERQLLAGKLTGNATWLAGWKAVFDQVESSEADRLSELHSQLRTALRGELDKLNEGAGLPVDGETSSSRLIDIMTAQLPELIDTSGQAARLGAAVLVNQRVKSSRRNELTLLRGNFNALVQWSMDGLSKVAREHPELASSLDDASSTLNTAYLGVQEAMTTKMLDTTDFEMSPETYLGLTAAALEQSLAVSAILSHDADQLLGARESLLKAQRNVVLLAMVAILALVIAGFVAAYISIMRGLNDLSCAVNTMAAGDLSARVEVSTRDEIGTVGTQFNLMVESLAQRTALLREKTNDIQNMLHHMPQGILTIVQGGAIHAEYSDYLETIFETDEVRGKSAIDFIFGNGSVGADALSQVEASMFAGLGEERMNFDFNAHLLAGAVSKTMADGRVKHLELSWSPICNDDDIVEKIMVCVRDVSELRLLEAEADQQKRELQMIGQILSVSQEKFHAFVAGARAFVAQNEALLHAADDRHPELVTQLFRNMHTIKGNARTYGLLHLANIVHEAEQAYDDLRHGARFDQARLLDQLQQVMVSIEEYASLNEVKLGRKGPGRRGSAEKYVMVERTQVETMVSDLEKVDLRSAQPEQLAAALSAIKIGLRRVGSESIQNILAGVFESLPSLARELGKEPPKLQVNDHGIRLQNQAADLLRNVFMHLYRNSIDHGIEEIADRFKAGKHPAGTIRLDLALVDQRLQMRLEDDGQGLALGRIRRKAIDQGLIGEGARVSDETVANLIFAAGFSTAAAVTDVSGRGVGMDAVQDFVKREGGTIRIAFTDQHEGADFRSFETVISLSGNFALSAARDVEETAGVRHKEAEPKAHKTLADLRSMVVGIVRPEHWAAF
jgi:two-component system chemotaxis sensor kinase CheA